MKYFDVRSIKKKKEDSLKYSTKDGAAYSVMAGFGDNFINPFAILLKATNTQIGLLTSVPQLIGSFSSIIGAKIVDKYKNRKKIVIVSVFLHALCWLLLFFIPYLTKSVTLLIILFSMYWIFFQFPGPAWNSWMGDLINKDERGKYFGKRNQVTGFFALIATFAAGSTLTYFSKIDPFIGFGVIFFIAFIARLVSFYYLQKKYEPVYLMRKEDHFSFLDFLKRIRKTNFGIFTIYVCLTTFSVYIFSPFVVVFMLRDLNFSYLQYSICSAISMAANFLMMTAWGRNSDTYGNKKILYVSGILVSIVPLLYVVNQSFTWIAITWAISGFSWAGFNLSTSNFIFDTVRPSKRAQAVAYYNVLRGIAVFLGASLGGFLATYLPSSIFMSNILILGIISAILRFALTLRYIPLIKEVKIVKSSPPLLHFITVMPVEGLFYDIVFGMKTSHKKFRSVVSYLSKKLKVSERTIRKKKRFFIRY